MESEIVFAALLFGAFLTTRVVFSVREGLQPAGGRDRRVSYVAPNPFHAVSIVPGQECCREIATLQRESFLSDDAPALPLPGCSRSRPFRIWCT